MKRPSVSLLMILFLLVRIHFCAANASQVAEGTLLIQNARIISMAPESSPFEGYMLVGKDGRITAIGENTPAAATISAHGDSAVVFWSFCLLVCCASRSQRKTKT